MLFLKKSLVISKRQYELINRRKTVNSMANRKTKGQTTILKTKDRTIRTPLEVCGERRCLGSVSNFSSTGVAVVLLQLHSKLPFLMHKLNNSRGNEISISVLFDLILELSRECGILFVFVLFCLTNYQFYCILASIKISGFFYSMQ